MTEKMLTSNKPFAFLAFSTQDMFCFSMSKVLLFFYKPTEFCSKVKALVDENSHICFLFALVVITVITISTAYTCICKINV